MLTRDGRERRDGKDGRESLAPSHPSHPSRPSPPFAYLAIAAAATLWGSTGVLSKLVYAEGLSAWSLIFFRGLLGFLGCGVVILLAGRSWLRVAPRDLPFLALYGLVSTSAFFALYHYTISVTTVAVAVVLLYTAPAFAAAISRFAFGEALTRMKLLALGLSFVGCALVAGIQSSEPAVSLPGILTGLGSALTYALFGIMGKQARRRYGPWTILFYSMGFATLFLMPVLMLPGMSIGPFPAQVWVVLAALALGPTLLSRVLYVAAVKHIEASRAAVVATVEPVAAAAFAFVVLGELLSPSQLLGGALVLAGAVLIQTDG